MMSIPAILIFCLLFAFRFRGKLIDYEKTVLTQLDDTATAFHLSAADYVR